MKLATKLIIQKLTIEAKHGVHPHEKESAQRFQVSVVLECNLDKARQTDELTDTLDWSALRDTIVATVQDNSFNLIERLAQAVADDLLVDPRIQNARVRIDKLDAFPSGVPGIEIEVAQSDQE